MAQQNNNGDSSDYYCESLKAALTEKPRVSGSVGSARAPAVADVMGGIGEDSGSLVLTATLGLSFVVSAWRVAGQQITVRLVTEAGRGPGHDISLPLAEVSSAPYDAHSTIGRCSKAEAEWAAPVYLILQHSIRSGVFPAPTSGLMFLVQTDLPPDLDFGRHTVLATATLEALCRLDGKQIDRPAKSQMCSDAAEHITGMRSVRIALTALAGMGDGGLMQVQFHPHPTCEPLALPPGTTILPTRTILGRPVSRERMIETRLCTEMSHYLLSQMGATNGGLKVDRLSAITPPEFLERYKRVFPQKISGEQFKAKFGDALRGLNGSLDSKEIYKVRSRAEHHVYENTRVHEFAAALIRARRSNAQADFIEAGERMYGSHWSYSQRCGIGGVETDRIVSIIRKYGNDAGLFGAKVTGGGAGGEMVVLMRDDAAAQAALAKALAEAQAASNRTIHTYRGSLAGAELFQPQFAGAV